MVSDIERRESTYLADDAKFKSKRLAEPNGPLEGNSTLGEVRDFRGNW